MDLPISSAPSVSSAIVEAVGPTQLPVLTVTPSQIYALNMTSRTENERGMRPPAAISTNFLEQDAPSRSYPIDIHSMEGAPMISGGLASFVPAAQSVLSSTPSTVVTTAQLIDLVPLNESHTPSFTSASSSLHQNSGPEVRQLQGNPNVGQPVPAPNQSTLPGIQQLGVNNNNSSVHQNSGPEIEGDPSVGQPMAGMQQLGGNNIATAGGSNNTTANMPQSQPRTTASRPQLSLIYEGYLFMRKEGLLVFITRIKGFRSVRSPELHTIHFPRGLQILRHFNFNRSSYWDCFVGANLILFQATRGKHFLRDMKEQNLCAVVELSCAVLYLFALTDRHLGGLLCPTNTSQQLELRLRGELHGSSPNQQLFMSQLLQQDPHVHVQAWLSRREVHQFQQQYIGEIQTREWFRRQEEQQVSAYQSQRRLYHNHLQRPEMLRLLSLQSRLQDLRECVQRLQHQVQQQGPLLQEQQIRWAGRPVLQSQLQDIQEHIQQMLQHLQQQGQLHQEQQRRRAWQPVALTEYEWSRRVIYSLHFNANRR